MTDLIGLYVDPLEQEKDLYSYPSWWLSSLSRLPCSLGQSSFRVATPKSRYHRRNYYHWLKHVDIPKANWLLITLTLTRENMPLAVAWLLIGYFISLFLNRMRNYFRRSGKKISYIWFIEPHEDGYPHVHILISFPFVSIDRIVNWWRDGSGNPLSAPQGVDVKFIGQNTQQVRDYLLKYLVKSHHKLFTFQALDRIRGFTFPFRALVRLSTLLIWLFSVRLFGRSQGLFLRPAVGQEVYTFQGFVSTYSLYRFRYAPINVDFSEFLLGMYYTESLDLSQDTIFELLT